VIIFEQTPNKNKSDKIDSYTSVESFTKSEKVRNKIIVLYIISRLPGITVPDLTGLALDTCYMNYFSFATAFDDLYNDKFITKSYRKNEEITDANDKPVLRCDATESGHEILKKLNHIIPEHIFQILSDFIKDWGKTIRKNSEIIASYDPDLHGGYIVNLKLSDGFKETVLIKLSVPAKQIAINICNNWKTNTQEKYLSILSILS